MTDKAAHFISLIFHPLFCFPIVLLILFQTLEFPQFDTSGFLIIWLVSVLFSVILPVSFTKYITSDVFLINRKDRYIPLLFTGIIYIVLYFLIKQFFFYDFVYDFLLSIIIVLIILFLLNFKWKISIHTSAMGSLTALFYNLDLKYPDTFFLYLLLVIFIAGLTGSARLKLKAHNEFEVYSGYLLGFLVCRMML